MRWGCCLVVLALSLGACARKHVADTGMTAAHMDAGMDAGSLDGSRLDAGQRSRDAAMSGSDASWRDAAADGGGRVADGGGHVADSGRHHPPVRVQSRAGCTLTWELVFGEDRSWVFAHCDGNVGTMTLRDLQFDGHASEPDHISEAVLAKDYVVYREVRDGLYSLRLADGVTTPLLGYDVLGLLELTPDKRHIVVSARDFSEFPFAEVVDVSGIEAPIWLGDSFPWAFKALSADGSTAFLQRGYGGVVKSARLTGGGWTELGNIVLSTDAMQYAALDASTGNVTVSFVNGTAPITFQEPGITQANILGFTRDGSALLLEGPDGRDHLRRASLNTGGTMSLADAPLYAKTPSSYLGTSVLYRWCYECGDADSGHFYVVPLDGTPALMSSAFRDCGTKIGAPAFTKSGDRSVFIDKQGGLTLVDARARTMTVVLKNMSPKCEQSGAGFSEDGSKVYAVGSFGVRVVDEKGTLLFSNPSALPRWFSPHSAHMVTVVDKELQLIELASGDVLYRTPLAADLTVANDDTFEWIDDERFIYVDANTVYLVHL